MIRRPPRSTRTDSRCPCRTLFRSQHRRHQHDEDDDREPEAFGAHRARDVARVERHQHCLRRLEIDDARGAEQRRALGRSEEHTSELQSLMRISYAVFCLKKKKEKTDIVEKKSDFTDMGQTAP